MTPRKERWLDIRLARVGESVVKLDPGEETRYPTETYVPASLLQEEQERVEELERALRRILTEKSVYDYDGPLGKNHEENPISAVSCRAIAREALRSKRTTTGETPGSVELATERSDKPSSREDRDG